MQEQDEMDITFHRLHDSTDKVTSLKEMKAKLEERERRLRTLTAKRADLSQKPFKLI